MSCSSHLLSHSRALSSHSRPPARLYRAATLKALKVSPFDELHWLNRISLQHLKNYQIWHHRQVVMSMHAALPIDEIRFLELMLSKDAKNYHVWSYRQWLVARFDLWPEPPSLSAALDVTATGSEPEAAEQQRQHHGGDRGDEERGGSELDFTEHLLHHDVRNNSAWNHRFFVVFGRAEKGLPVSRGMCEREVDFAKAKIELAPQNAAAWNYLKGVIARMGEDVRGLEAFAAQFADVDRVDEVRSSHALDFLAGVWAKGQVAKAKKALELLADRFDPIRKGYWEYRKGELPTEVDVPC